MQKSLAISLSEEQISPSFIKKLKEMLEPVSGGTLPINVYYQSAKGRALLRLGFNGRLHQRSEILNRISEFTRRKCGRARIRINIPVKVRVKNQCF